MMNEEIIYKYTDAQAVEDGVLVDISGYRLGWLGRPVNRITRTLFDALAEFAVGGNDVRRMLMTKLRYARPSGDDAGMFILPPDLWMLPNEIGGWTVMFPDDY